MQSLSKSSTWPFLLQALLVVSLSQLSLSAAHNPHGYHIHRAAQNAIPKFPYDENTTRFCAWWLDNDSDGIWTCAGIEQSLGVSMQDFHKWNPSITIPCTTLPSNQSFCIAAYEIPASSRSSRGPILSSAATVTLTVPVTVSIPVSVPYTVPVPTTLPQVQTVTRTTTVYPAPVTSPGNGITTPVPYQPGMITNCKIFHYVQKGETCVDIAAKYRVSPEQIIAWNPYSRADCTRLLANTYCCVGVL